MAKTPLQKQFGARVRQLRKARGWTQEAFGQRCDMDYKYLGAVERGERNITMENIQRIAKGLEVEPFQLFVFTRGRPGSPPKAQAFSKEKIYSHLNSFDERSRSLLLKISEDIATWQEKSKKK